MCYSPNNLSLFIPSQITFPFNSIKNTGLPTPALGNVFIVPASYAFESCVYEEEESVFISLSFLLKKKSEYVCKF